MNTVESIIKEELGKTLVDIVIKDIKGWAKKEINYLRYALSIPVVIPINDKLFVVNEYTIQIIDDTNHIVKKDGKLVHNFLNKKAAMLYVVLEKTRNFTLSNELLTRDKIAAKMHSEITFYTKKISNKTAEDNFKRELWISRYLESRAQYHLAKRELEKTISNAKYMKIWDKIL